MVSKYVKMMKIANLGATSQIAKDLIGSFSAEETERLHLFALRPDDVKKWLNDIGLSERYLADDFVAFGTQEFDAILNFVGIGNPAQAVAMGASIFDVSLQYDELALNYVRQHPECRYIFLITDILRAIRDKTLLKTSADYIVRDFIGPDDFHQLVNAILIPPATNDVVDCYSKAPVDEPTLLSAMQAKYDLQYELVQTITGINETDRKPHYYSLNKRALDFGYVPKHTSLEIVLND